MTWMEAAEDVLAALSAETGVPYDFERHTPAPGETQLPDMYVVYFLVDDPTETAADNRARTHQPRVQVSFFYRDTRQALTLPGKITASFSEVGFGVGNAGNIPYQPDTGHHGWRRDFYYYENF